MAIPNQSAETPSVTGRQQLVRFALRDGDPFNIIRLLEVRTRESADLVFAFEMLRRVTFPTISPAGPSVRAPILVARSTTDLRGLRARKS